MRSNPYHFYWMGEWRSFKGPHPLSNSQQCPGNLTAVPLWLHLDEPGCAPQAPAVHYIVRQPVAVAYVST